MKEIFQKVVGTLIRLVKAHRRPSPDISFPEAFLFLGECISALLPEACFL
jgi:hypothetical protein